MPGTMQPDRQTTAGVVAAANGGAAQARAPENQHDESLLPHGVSDNLRTQWEAIQAEFVDDPRVSVQRADELVATAIKRLAESFAAERAKLEQAWSKGNDVSTEDLRQALRRYRAFFQRLLSV